jgi:predicted transcriptional regulator
MPPRTITLDAQASQFVEQKVAAGEAATADAFVSQLVAEKRAEEAAHDRWFRDKVMKGIAEADAGEFATPAEVEATLKKWR